MFGAKPQHTLKVILFAMEKEPKPGKKVRHIRIGEFKDFDTCLKALTAMAEGTLVSRFRIEVEHVIEPPMKMLETQDWTEMSEKEKRSLREEVEKYANSPQGPLYRPASDANAVIAECHKILDDYNIPKCETGEPCPEPECQSKLGHRLRELLKKLMIKTKVEYEPILKKEDLPQFEEEETDREMEICPGCGNDPSVHGCTIDKGLSSWVCYRDVKKEGTKDE